MAYPKNQRTSKTNKNKARDYTVELTGNKDDGGKLGPMTAPGKIAFRAKILLNLLTQTKTDLLRQTDPNENEVKRSEPVAKLLRSSKVRLILNGHSQKEIIFTVKRGDDLIQREDGLYVEAPRLARRDSAAKALDKAISAVEALIKYGEFAKQVIAAVSSPRVLPPEHPDRHFNDVVKYVYGTKWRDQWAIIAPIAVEHLKKVLAEEKALAEQEARESAAKAVEELAISDDTRSEEAAKQSAEAIDMVATTEMEATKERKSALADLTEVISVEAERQEGLADVVSTASEPVELGK